MARSEDEYPVLRLNDASLSVLRGEREVILREPLVKVKRRRKTAEESWEGVDETLFERLRKLRHGIAKERDVQAYVIFDDKTLREIAKHLPTNAMEFLEIKGVGDKKLADFGPIFMEEVRLYQSEGNRPN